MESMFLSVLNMSLTASYVIAAIMLVRLFLKKAPKVISYVLWAVAGFRLVFPFSFESVFSLIPFKSSPIPADIAVQPIPRVDSGIMAVDNAVGRVLPAAEPIASANQLQIWQTVGTCLWLIGIAALLIYSIVSIILLKRQLREAVLAEGNIYEAENLKTPFVLGFLRPKIYIPASLSTEERSYVILHEQTHIRRFDHVVKLFAFLVLCVHWFNPLVWIAFILMTADMEMSCDERVLKEMGGDIKKAYSTSLLSMATGRRLINGSPLAFGEGNIKGRIKNVLNFKKPAAWVIAVSVVLVVALSVGFATNRASNNANNSIVTPEVTATQVTLYRYSGDAANPLGSPLLQDGSEVQLPGTVAMQIHYPKDTVKLFLYCQSVSGKTVVLRSVDFAVMNERAGMTPDIRNPDIFVWNITDQFSEGFSGTIWAEAESASDNMFPYGVKPKSDVLKAIYTAETGQKSDRRPMLMVNGEIYMDTGKQMSADFDDMTMLGSITSSIGQSEMPKQNGESNFGLVGAPYLYWDDGLAVKLNDKWYYFEKDTTAGIAISQIPKGDYDTIYDKVEIAILLGERETPIYDFESVDYQTVAYIDTMIRQSSPYDKSPPQNSQTKHYNIRVSNEISSYACGLYYDTLNNEAYIVRDGGPSITDVEFAQYIVSIYDSAGKLEQIVQADVNQDGKVEIVPTSPKISPDQPIGIAMPQLDYADDNIVIFHGDFGMFVYDLRTQTIIRSLDLGPISCDQVQGSDACDVVVSKDGGKVFMRTMETKKMYVWNLTVEPALSLSRASYDSDWPKPDERFRMASIETALPNNTDLRYSYSAADFGNGEYGYLHATDWTLSALTYVRSSDYDIEYKLFMEDTP